MPPSGDDLSAQAAQLKAALPVKRNDGRKPEHLRPARIETGYTTQAEGSVLIATHRNGRMPSTTKTPTQIAISQVLTDHMRIADSPPRPYAPRCGGGRRM